MMKPDDSTLESAIKSRIMILADLDAYVSGFEISSGRMRIPTIIFDCSTNYRSKYGEVFKAVGACWCAEIVDSKFKVCCELIIDDKESMFFIEALH